MSKLIIFDIDGTLIHTNDFEDKFYIQAVHHTFGENIPINTDWPSYQYSTDIGVFFEITQKAYSRSPTKLEFEKMQDYFIRLLFQAYSKNTKLFNSLPGASDIFNQIKSTGWDVAIATGCCQPSAELKLKVVGLDTENIPMSTSSDHFDRKDIIQASIERAKLLYNKPHYSNIIYVGDRPWDKKAAESLGIDFIGMGEHWQNPEYTNFTRANDYTCGTVLNHLKNQV